MLDMFLLFRSSFLAAALLLLPGSRIAAAEVSAKPYIPLNPGAEAEQHYKFAVDSNRKEFTQANTTGRIIVKAEGWEEIEGKRYLRYVTTYHEIPFMKEKVTFWRREEGGVVYIRSAMMKGYRESIELPSNPVLGTKWEYNDGEQSEREVTALTSFKLGDGIELQDCVEVSRRVTKNKGLSNITNKVVYCRGYGDTSSLFIQPSPVGDYRTETRLVRYKPGL